MVIIDDNTPSASVNIPPVSDHVPSIIPPGTVNNLSYSQMTHKIEMAKKLLELLATTDNATENNLNMVMQWALTDDMNPTELLMGLIRPQ